LTPTDNHPTPRQRQSKRDISDNQKRLACRTNRDNHHLATGRRIPFRSPPPVSSRLTRYTDAIQYAVERLPDEVQPTTSIEVDHARYDAGQIRALYENDDYPLARK